VRAVVLTCDRYRPFTEHMLRCYADLWPGHPFVFRIPYQGKGERAHGPGPRELVRCKEGVRATVLGLVGDLADEEWIYWCPDDKHPVNLEVERAGAIASWVAQVEDPAIGGVSFARCRELLLPSHADGRGAIEAPPGEHLLRRHSFRQIWLHQFLRAGVLRRLFEALPGEPGTPKEMDRVFTRMGYFSPGSPTAESEGLYVMRENAVVFGESTRGGHMTRNCAASFQAHGIGLPVAFPITEQRVTMGELPARMLRLTRWAGRARQGVRWAMDRARMSLRGGRGGKGP
jgi:hypothetical protein